MAFSEKNKVFDLLVIQSFRDFCQNCFTVGFLTGIQTGLCLVYQILVSLQLTNFDVK